MRFLPLLLFFICLTSCSVPEWIAPLPPWESVPKPKPAIHTEESTHVLQGFTVDMERLKNIHLEHAKTCYNADGIHTVQLEFISQDLIELCEARKLIVDLTEDLLTRLNESIVLGPEFAVFPFMPKNLEIYITYESYFGKYVDPRYICWICLEDNVVSFYTWELKYNENRCWSCKKEPYATSREIVVYQREAERKYEEVNQPKPTAFGPERYFPESGK